MERFTNNCYYIPLYHIFLILTFYLKQQEMSEIFVEF